MYRRSKFALTFLPTTRDFESYRRSRLLVESMLVLICISILYGILYTWMGYVVGIMLCLGSGILSLICWIWFRWWAAFIPVTYLFLTIANIFFLGMSCITGGLASPFTSWLIPLPMLSFLILGKWRGFLWAGICLSEIIGLFVFEWQQGVVSDIHRIHTGYSLLLELLCLLLFMIVLMGLYLEGRKLALLELEQAHAETSAKNKALEAQTSYIERVNKEIRVQHSLLEVQNAKIKQMNQDLERAVRERTALLQRTNEELDMFLYRASHDLRRPVTSLMGLFEIVRLEFGKPAGFELIDKMNTTAQNMDKMLRKLTMISEVHQNYPNPVPLDWDSLIHRAIYPLQNFAATSGVRIEHHLSIDREIYSIPLLLEAIIYNLIENAIAFRQPNCLDSFVKLMVQNNDTELCIVVQDNGIGIPSDQFARVWKMFWRASTQSQGNGLGLYIVSKAVERLQGNTDIRSEEGEGSTIYINLPIKTLKNLGVSVII